VDTELNIVFSVLIIIISFVAFVGFIYTCYLCGNELYLIKKYFNSSKKILVINKLLIVLLWVCLLVVAILSFVGGEYDNWNISILSPLGIMIFILILLMSIHIWFVGIVRNRLAKIMAKEVDIIKKDEK